MQVVLFTRLGRLGLKGLGGRGPGPHRGPEGNTFLFVFAVLGTDPRAFALCPQSF